MIFNELGNITNFNVSMQLNDMVSISVIKLHCDKSTCFRDVSENIHDPIFSIDEG